MIVKMRSAFLDNAVFFPQSLNPSRKDSLLREYKAKS